jgi:hypothetical protein
LQRDELGDELVALGIGFAGKYRMQSPASPLARQTFSTAPLGTVVKPFTCRTDWKTA